MKCVYAYGLAIIAGLVFLIASQNMSPAFSGGEGYVCKLNPNGDNYLSMRTCPRSSCREIHRLGPGTRIMVLEPSGRWLDVQIKAHRNDRRFTGLRGWVFGKYTCGW